jgi:hypothetical protein
MGLVFEFMGNQAAHKTLGFAVACLLLGLFSKKAE